MEKGIKIGEECSEDDRAKEKLEEQLKVRENVTDSLRHYRTTALPNHA